MLQRPELYTPGVRQPGMADAEFVQEFRSATYDKFECSNLPPGASSRERLCVQHILNALESCFAKGGGEAIGTQAYTPTLGSTVFQAAVLWGRLFSYVARAIDSILPALDESKPFPVGVLQSDEAYANTLFECLRKKSTKRKHDRSSKRMWSCTDELFHFTRGIEWFLDMHASVYTTGSQFRDDHKLLITSVKHLYPSTFHQTWEQCSFEPCAQPPKVRITRSHGSVQWERLRRAHVDYHLLFLKGECNRLVSSEPMSRKGRRIPTGAEEESDSDEDQFSERNQNRAILASFKRSQVEDKTDDPEDVDKDIRRQWFANRRREVLENLNTFFDEVEKDAKFADPDDESTDVFGERWLSQKLSEKQEVLESEQLENKSAKLLKRKKDIIESQSVSEENRLWFQEVFDIGVDKAKAMDDYAQIKTGKLKAAEEIFEFYEEKQKEYKVVREEVVRLYDILAKHADPFADNGYVEKRDPSYQADGRQVKTALLRLIDAIEELGNVWFDETQRGVDSLKRQSSSASGILNAMKESTSIIDRLYTITFGLTSPTTVTVRDTKFNLFTATPSKSLSERYAATLDGVTQKFRELMNYKNASSPAFIRPHKFMIDFQAENDEFFDKLTQALVGSGVSARAVQRASNKVRGNGSAAAKASDSVSKPVPVYFYMGSKALTETAVSAMPDGNDREVLMALDSVLEHQKDGGARTRVGPEVAPPEKPLQWFKRIGADTAATVNQAWLVETMDAAATMQVSFNTDFSRFKTLSNLIECDGIETQTMYRTNGLSFLDDVWKTETDIMTPKVSRIVFRFPQDAGKVDTMQDAVETIMQYTYASSQLVGAKVGAIYVFSPDRLSDPEEGRRKEGWGVMIVMERMDVKILRNEKLGQLKSKDPVEYNKYVATENAYLSRLWILIARMSAAGIAFMDSHGDNIMAVPSKYGGFAPRLVDFDSRWGCVLSRSQLVPDLFDKPENKEALRTHPGWRPLYVLNILFVAFQLRIDDSRARVFDQWMSIATSASRDDSRARSVQKLTNQSGKSKTIDRETHIRILIANELEYLKTGKKEHFNVAHRVLNTTWSGGFWGGVDLVLRPDVAEELKHDAAQAYLQVGDDYMNRSRFLLDSKFKANPFVPNFLPTDHDAFQQLVWGATVKIFDNGFKGLNSRQSLATVHANMIARQTSVRETNAQSVSEDDTTPLRTSEFMGIVGRMSMLTRQVSLNSDAFVKKNASRVFRRLNHFFCKREGSYNILELLYEFVMAPPSSLPLPPSMTRDEAGAMLSDGVMQPVRRVSDVRAYVASQMMF